MLKVFFFIQYVISQRGYLILQDQIDKHFLRAKQTLVLELKIKYGTIYEDPHPII